MNSELQSLNSYSNTLKSFASGQRLKTVPAGLPGLRNVLNSMSSYSPHTYEPHLEEWNPFSQRPIFEINGAGNNGLDRDFTAVTVTAHRYITLAHEAMHILMWEPFFSGYSKPEATTFGPWSLAFEGFCFWIADVKLTPKVQLREPDGQMTLRRHAVSQPTFHPLRAFEDLEMTDTRTILDAYLLAFGGFESRLSQTRKMIPRNLAMRAYSFFDSTKKPPVQMFENFKLIGLFEEYFERFCKNPGMPSLFPSELLKIDLKKNLHEYCHQVYSRGLPFVEGLCAPHIERVRQRRALQTRAYFAFALRHLVRANQVEANSHFRTRPTAAMLEAYIDTLALLTQKLAAGGAPRAIAMELDTCDRRYSRTLKRHFTESQAFSGRRECIVPTLAGHSLLQPGEDRTHLKAKNLTAFAAAIAPMALKVRSPELIREIRKLAERLADCKQSRQVKPAVLRRLSQQIDVVLRNGEFIKFWSTPLSSFDPEQNSFRELLFTYI